MTRLPGKSEPGVQRTPKQATLWQVVKIVVSMLFMIGRRHDYALKSVRRCRRVLHVALF